MPHADGAAGSGDRRDLSGDVAGQPAREGEPEPCSVAVLRPVPPADAGLEDLLALVLVDPGPVVFDDEERRSVLALDRHVHVAASVPAGVLEDRLEDAPGEPPV